MELEESQGIIVKPPLDHLPRLEEPPPVRLLTVEDATLVAAAGLERDLDEFYIGLFQFVREEASEAIVYRAENFRLRFKVIEPPFERSDFYPTRIEVPLLRDLEKLLIERELEYERLKGLLPGQQALALFDPAGNYIEVTEFRRI
jgi:hypothetical protein